jgi:3-deoxy-D-manno-octulosonic-acid transferase
VKAPLRSADTALAEPPSSFTASLLAYNLALLLVALILAPFAAIACLAKPRWRESLGSRLGLGWPRPARSPVLWAHAASVGEIEGIAPLVRRWQDENPAGEVIVSALTATGCAAAHRLLPGSTVRVFPLDLPPIAGRVVRAVRPSLFVFSENEIWPNVLQALHRARVPIVQVSGRLSSGAATTLARFPSFARAVMSLVTRFCVQGEEHRRRLIDLGVAPERIIVTGSLKGDAQLAEPPPFLASLTALERPLVVAGSTHPGEEEPLLDAIAALARRSPRPLWILAPRHPERFATVAALVAERGIAMLRRSALPADPQQVRARASACDVLLLDSLGELAGCYRAATAAFVGGSLVPVGGHNVLEPSRASVPVIVGPHVESIAALVAALERTGGASVVRSAAELADAVDRFLDADVGVRAGAAARDIAEQQAGSLPLTWASLEEVVRCGAERRSDS